MRSSFLIRSLCLLAAATLAVAAGCSREAPGRPDTGLAPSNEVLPADLGMRGSSSFCNDGLQSLQGGPGLPQLSDVVNNTTVYNTDFVVAGVGGMRDVGSANLSVAGITGPVALATLYWHGPTDSEDPDANASVMFAGFPIVGTNIGFSNDNCWGYTNSQSYKADVTGIVSAAGDGIYTLSGFGSGAVNTNGASLVVFFNDGDPLNNRDVVLFEGNDSNIPNGYDADGWNASLSGINYAAGTANLQLHVADGQDFGIGGDDAEILLNAATLEPFGQIFAGNSVPSANNGPDDNGSLWDIRSWDVTAFLSPGPNSLTLYSGVNADCLGLVLAVVDLPAGSAPGADAFFTGGGSIGVDPKGANFGFNAGPRTLGGPVKGQLQYHDRGAKKRVHGKTVETFIVVDDCVLFSGTCTVDNEPGYFYQVAACDYAEPGKDVDYFSITVWDGEGDVACQASGIITGGNVQKHSLLLNGPLVDGHLPGVDDGSGN